MKRRRVPEMADQAWCPPWFRGAMTGYLRAVIEVSRPYDGTADTVAALLRETGARRVLDLASGAGGPWPAMRDRIREQLGDDIDVTLTDLHPDTDAAARLAAVPGVTYRTEPVSALRPPREPDAIRTMYTALHHFEPDAVRDILAAAQRDRVAFAAFEATHRSARGILVTLLVPILVLLFMPRVRPLRFRTLLFTYLIPILPLAIWWDGLASTLRTYRAAEIDTILDEVREPGYRWDVDEAETDGPIPILRVVGRPV